MKYSAATGGFYFDSIHGVNVPVDAVEISDEHYDYLCQGQSNRKRIIPDGNGYPILQDPPELTIDEIRAAMQCSRWRFKRALTQLGWRADVEAFVASADQDTKDMYADAHNFTRLHPFIVAAGQLIGKTPDQIDQIFAIGNGFVE
ncbi:MAG: hypothetical protein M0Q44_01425 [Methylobacter sp.]|jgi:hypothetical protein|nr:hypothetical protein [Methylobacter sp.]